MPVTAVAPLTQPAGLRRRVASMAYECLLLVGVMSVCFMLPHLVLGIGFNVVLPGWVLLIHIFIVQGAYFIWYWHHGGQTLAMQTWKIRLTTPTGVKPSLARLALRYALSWPSLIYLAAGVFWALLDRDRQFLHDRLAGTCLVFSQD